MNCAVFLVITIMHARHTHIVVVVKKAYAQVRELKSNVHRLLLVVNNECHVYGIDSEQNTPLRIILCSVTFIGHVSSAIYTQ